MNELLHRSADALKISRGGGPRDQYHEDRDIHEIDHILGDDMKLARELDTFNQKAKTGTLTGVDFGLAQRAPGTAAGLKFAPEKIKTIKGMGTIWDYRSFTHPNGGKISTLLFVEHIPVIHQMAGRADLDVLWRVLVNQGLMVHNGTDAEGNIAFYVNMDRLCFHARGANSLSCGTEHMHFLTSEPWTSKQLNASAYLSYRCKKYQGMPYQKGLMGSGNGFVTARRRGHVTHEDESKAAGFNDRSDPGDLYVARMEDIADRARFYARHHHF